MPKNPGHQNRSVWHLQGKDLHANGVASVLRRTILDEVEEQLSRRNAMLEPGDKMLASKSATSYIRMAL
jgi:hypothetical protein